MPPCRAARRLRGNKGIRKNRKENSGSHRSQGTRREACPVNGVGGCKSRRLNARPPSAFRRPSSKSEKRTADCAEQRWSDISGPLGPAGRPFSMR